MTEAEWLIRADARPMLDWLIDGTETIRTRWHGTTEARRWRTSKRKLWLFLASVCRDEAGAMERPEPALRMLIRLEEWADAGAVGRFDPGDWHAEGWPETSELRPVDRVAELLAWTGQGGAPASTRDRIAQAGPQMREVVGNPFRPHPHIDPAWRAFADGAALRIAQDMHARRDFAAMPVLGDALEEAGCSDERVLSHLRRPGPHSRGCWALDLVLGKE